MQIMSIIVILLRFMYPDVTVQIKISIRKTKIIRIITNESNPQTEKCRNKKEWVALKLKLNQSSRQSLQKPEAMGMQAASAAASLSFIYSLKWGAPNSAQIFVTPSNKLPLKTNATHFPCPKFTNNKVKTRATLGEKDDIAPPTPLLVQEKEQSNRVYFSFS